MNEYENNNEFSTIRVMPNAAVIKHRDDTFHIIKFIDKNEVVQLFESELDSAGLQDSELMNELTHSQIVFVKIKFEFDYDEDQGVMEFELCESLTLTGLNDETIYVQDIIQESPEDIVSLYLDIIDYMDI